MSAQKPPLPAEVGTHIYAFIDPFGMWQELVLHADDAWHTTKGDDWVEGRFISEWRPL